MSASQIIGIFALVLWSFQLAPQVYKNYKARSTTGLSPYMMILWSFGSVCTAITSIGSRYSALFIIQPNLFLVFSLACWVQCYFYENKTRAILYGISMTILLVVIETGVSLVFLSLDLLSWPYMFVNILSLLFFVCGFIPQYLDIYQRKRVAGISLLFL